MKLSKTTLEILKNFATINQGLLFKPGKNLRTMNVMKNTFATAEISDEIPIEFAIYDMNELLAAYSLFDGCDILFQDAMLLLKSGGEEMEYNYSSPAVVVSPGDKNITLPSTDKKFVLTKEVLDKIMKVSSVMKLKDLEIDGTGVRILNRNASGNKHHIKLPVEVFNSDDIVSALKVDNLKLIPVDYDVTICQKGLARFTSRNEEYRVEYHIALESN